MLGGIDMCLFGTGNPDGFFKISGISDMAAKDCLEGRIDGMGHQ